MSVPEHSGKDGAIDPARPLNAELPARQPVRKPVIESLFSKVVTDNATHFTSREFKTVADELRAAVSREYDARYSSPDDKLE